MIKTKRHYGAVYTAPECVELEVITEGTVLSASAGIGASSEGYDVDDEKFNW